MALMSKALYFLKHEKMLTFLWHVPHEFLDEWYFVFTMSFCNNLLPLSQLHFFVKGRITSLARFSNNRSLIKNLLSAIISWPGHWQENHYALLYIFLMYCYPNIWNKNNCTRWHYTNKSFISIMVFMITKFSRLWMRIFDFLY